MVESRSPAAGALLTLAAILAAASYDVSEWLASVVGVSTAAMTAGGASRPQSHAIDPREDGAGLAGALTAASLQHEWTVAAGSGVVILGQGRPRSQRPHAPAAGAANTSPGSTKATIANARRDSPRLIRTLEQYSKSVHSVNWTFSSSSVKPRATP